MHARRGTQVGAFVEQRRPRLRDRLVSCRHEPVAGQDSQDLCPLDLGQGVDGGRPRAGRAEDQWLPGPVVTRTGAAQQRAGQGDPDLPRQVVDGRVDHRVDHGLESALSESISKSA